VLKNRDTGGERVQLEKYKLAKFYGLPRLCEGFLETFGVYPNRSITFLMQLADPGYAFDAAEIGRPMYEPFMASITGELVRVLGFAHPLDHEHVTPTLDELRPTLASTVYFREYSNYVKLFQGRALGNENVLASQKSATSALNHVFGKFGVHLKSKAIGRKDVKGGQDDGTKRRRVYLYAGWYLDRSPKSRTRPVVGPPGADLMTQLLKLHLEGSPDLKSRISEELKEHVDGVDFLWPELVRSDEVCMIRPRS
jgi:hypothetical protein